MCLQLSRDVWGHRTISYPTNEILASVFSVFSLKKKCFDFFSPPLTSAYWPKVSQLSLQPECCSLCPCPGFQMSIGQTDFDFQKPHIPQMLGAERRLPGMILLRKSRFLSQLFLLYFHTLFNLSPEMLYLCQTHSSLVAQGWLESAPLRDSLLSACLLVPLNRRQELCFFRCG